jgi:hypothetical protein
MKPDSRKSQIQSHFLIRGPIAVLAVAILCIAPVEAADKVVFARDVRPILARHCFKCHGPDDAKRAAGLRLDVRDAALGETKTGNHALVPGNIDESELVARIDSDDESDMMPPPSTKDPLTPAQKAILSRWVEQGAEYTPHWSFAPVKKVKVPAPAGSPEWNLNPIDRFIFEQLRQGGLDARPRAEKPELIRRVYLALTGLPPTPEETARFIADERPDAYERVVDSLLASPRYGERWARKWLDLARYADTNGYEKDRYRSVWPWRDWVIRAINSDMPFDQFTIRQIAGDMLPGATRDDIVATGFHRNTMLNEEGGIDPLEFRFYAMVDRVSTTGNVWLGMSLGCAQCHTHKYDPITHTEYYSVMAAMNNTQEPPEFDLNDESTRIRQARHDRRIEAMIAALPSKFPPEAPTGPTDGRSEEQRRSTALDRAFTEWSASAAGAAVEWTLLEPKAMKANLARLSVRPDGSIFADGDATKHDEYELTIESLPAGTRAIRLEVLPDPELPAGGPGRTDYEGPLGDFFLSELKAEALTGESPAPLRFASASESFGKLGIGGGASGAELAFDGNMQTGWSTNGRQGHEEQAVFILDTAIAKPSDIKLTMIFERHYSAPLGRFRLWSTTTEAPTAKHWPTRIESILKIGAEKRSPDETTRLKNWWIRNEAPIPDEAIKAIEAAEKNRPAATSTLIMKERPAGFVRPTFLHKRGEWLQPANEVQPGTPAFLNSPGNPAPHNRLELARWLVSPEHPLTARVTVNRHWAALFGRGIVRTQEDFGYQGELPSHPELLDWLARTFVSTDEWSIKKLHRRIVTSEAWKQSSVVTPEALEKDPDNRFVSRGPRFRLDGESIRDSALAVAGLLSHKVGGPSVFPPQPASVTTEGAYGKLDWKTSTGEDRYRRSLYTFAKRTTPFAMLNTFDAPSGEACVVRRDVSNSALQSLTLLNDPVFLEAAQALGRQFAADARPDSDRLMDLNQRLFQRSIDATIRDGLQQFIEAQREHYRKNPDAAKLLVGDPATADPAEAAAWTVLVRALLNTDEFIVPR